jgi:hypothetical protein
MLGVLALHEHDYVRARRLFEESIAAMGGEAFGTVVNLSNLALAAFRLGELSEAAARLQECLALSLTLHDHVSMTHALEVLAALLAARGDGAFAGRVLGSNAAMREEEGLSLQELEAELHEETEALIRGQLGPDRFTLELESGREAELDGLIQTAIARLD